MRQAVNDITQIYKKIDKKIEKKTIGMTAPMGFLFIAI